MSANLRPRRDFSPAGTAEGTDTRSRRSALGLDSTGVAGFFSGAAWSPLTAQERALVSGIASAGRRSMRSEWTTWQLADAAFCREVRAARRCEKCKINQIIMLTIAHLFGIFRAVKIIK